MILQDQKILKRMERMEVRLIRLGRGRTYAAYPHGDRRKRALFYMEADQVERLCLAGYLTAIKGKQFVLRDMDGSAPYIPPRKGCNNRRPVLERLSSARAGHMPFLTPSEVQAGYRLQADFARLEFGAMPGPRYEKAGGTRKSPRGPETSMAGRIDTQARITAALATIDADMAKILTAIIGQGAELAAYEAQMEMPFGEAKRALKAALGALARHYENVSQTPE